MLTIQQLPPVEHELVMLTGGFDETTPSYSLAPGCLRDCFNFACRAQGGYYRIPGYERRDGRRAPSTATIRAVTVAWNVGAVKPANGERVNIGAQTATVLRLNLDASTLRSIQTTAGLADAMFITDIAGAGDLTDVTLRIAAMMKAKAANIYRALIQPVPGSGPILGTFILHDICYAFRNNAGGTAAVLWKESAAGWVQVDLGSLVPFSAATFPGAAGNTLL
jgi:hypothetical protein